MSVVARFARMLPRKYHQAMEHVLRKPVESSRAYKQRRQTIALAMLLALGVASALAVLLMG